MEGVLESVRFRNMVVTADLSENRLDRKIKARLQWIEKKIKISQTPLNKFNFKWKETGRVVAQGQYRVTRPSSFCFLKTARIESIIRLRNKYQIIGKADDSREKGMPDQVGLPRKRVGSRAWCRGSGGLMTRGGGGKAPLR